MFRANRIWLAAIVFLAAALFPIASTQTRSKGQFFSRRPRAAT